MPKKPKKAFRPIDIALPEGVLLENDSMFVVLGTLDELESFWKANGKRFPFGIGGINVGDAQTYLRPYDWVFASTKAAAIATMLRWGQSPMSCEFYEWAVHEPDAHLAWFADRDQWRAESQKRGTWTHEREAAYQADCVARSPETYRGWWQFTNLPNGLERHEWWNPAIHGKELLDRNMNPAEAARRLHEHTFDDWMESDSWELDIGGPDEIEDTIQYWRNEQANGESYYGDENEPQKTSK